MFCVYNGENQVIAIHDSKKVVKKYIENVKTHYPKEELYIGKLKNYDKKRDYDNLYLIRYNFTYIQMKYIDYILTVDNGYVQDYNYAKEILIRILETHYKMKKKDRKKLSDAIILLDKYYDRESNYTPNISECERIKASLEPYYYNMYYDE